MHINVNWSSRKSEMERRTRASSTERDAHCALLKNKKSTIVTFVVRYEVVCLISYVAHSLFIRPFTVSCQSQWISYMVGLLLRCIKSIFSFQIRSSVMEKGATDLQHSWLVWLPVGTEFRSSPSLWPEPWHAIWRIHAKRMAAMRTLYRRADAGWYLIGNPLYKK